MTLEKFKSSLMQESPPEEINNLLLVLWYEGKDNWNKAHKLAQGINDSSGAWVHASLHRKEGDNSNAAYWY